MANPQPPEMRLIEIDRGNITREYGPFTGNLTTVPRPYTSDFIDRICNAMSNGEIDVTNLHDLELRRELFRYFVKQAEIQQVPRNGVRGYQVAMQMVGTVGDLGLNINSVRRQVEHFRSVSALLRTSEFQHELNALNVQLGNEGLRALQHLFGCSRQYAIRYVDHQSRANNLAAVGIAVGNLRDALVAHLGPGPVQQNLLTTAQTTIATRDATINQMQNDAAARDATINQMQNDLTTAQTSLQILQQQNGQLLDTMEQNMTHLQSANDKVDKLQGSVQELEEKNEAANAAVRTLKSSIKLSRDENSELSKLARGIVCF